MKIIAIVPAKGFENAKTRMSPMLNPPERIMLSSLMLDRTLQVLAQARQLQQVAVVSNDRQAELLAAKYGAKFLYEEKQNGVNSAVSIASNHSIRENADVTLVIPLDLPLLDRADIDMLCELADQSASCVIICPSQRYDGTNALLRKPPCTIRTFFDNNSYEAHINAAAESNVPVRIFLSRRLMSDIDTPDDARQLVREVADSEAHKNNKIVEFLKSKR